jgi:putative membrane-bound dehydrogenase-like protein
MMPQARLGAVLGLCAAAVALAPRPQEKPQAPKADLVASTEAQTPEQERAAFHLPPGFEAQLVAAEPDIHKPMNLSFDDRGRLWVTSTVEYPYPAQVGSAARDEVKILDDFAADGRARRVTAFASGLNIPIGILPTTPSEALVYSIPNIDRFADTDGDGRSDRRESYYGRVGFRDTHGMANAFTWGFDGWIYGCHGFSNDSTVKGRDGVPIVMNSGNTYRFRPDGSHIEQFTWGQVNPFGLCFDPLGNLYSCDCHTRPIFQLLRGAYYDSFGKPHDGLGYGPEMMTHDHFSTGIAGISYYAADHFPAPWRDTIMVGNVVTSRINHDKLEWHGSTPVAVEQPDFLVSDDPWFRPVDLEVGPDGALYVADFYNRIIGHYEVPLTHPGRDRERGRIWRIVYRGPDDHAPAVASRSDWTKATTAELRDDLGHANMAVRIRAANQLVARGADDAARSAAHDAQSPFARVHGLWALFRLGTLDDGLLAHAVADPDRSVRVHAQRIVGELPGELTDARRAFAIAGLGDADALVRRAAAESLGRHPASVNVRALLDTLHGVPPDDSHLRHVVRMALRDQLRPDAAWRQLGAFHLSADDLRAIADVAPGVPSGESARFLLTFIRRGTPDAETLVRYVHHIARRGDGSSDQTLLDFVRGYRPDDGVLQASVMKTFQRGMEERGATLLAAARRHAISIAATLLGSSRQADLAAGTELAEALRLHEAVPALNRLTADASQTLQRRAAAITALVAIDAAAAQTPLAAILDASNEPVGLREHAAGALARTNRDDARAELLKVLPTAPGRLQTAIAAGLAAQRAGADALLELVRAGKASARLLQEPAVKLWLGQSGVPDLQAKLDSLTAGLPPDDERIQKLLDLRRDGLARAKADPARGAQVFEKTCAACHQIGGKGAKVGPQLDGVGIRGADRLIEDLLDPNRNVDQAFRMTSLALNSGQNISGLLLKEEGEILILADSEGKEVRVAKSSVEERKVSPLSPMPANLAEQVSEPDFYDLLAYLLAQQQAGAGR